MRDYVLFMSECGNDHLVEETTIEKWETILAQAGPGRINEGHFSDRKLAESHRDKLRANGEYK